MAHGHPWLYAVGIVTAGITAYYMFRLLFITFLGEYRGEAHVHTGGTAATIMSVPVAILVAPTVAIGGALMFGGEASPWAHYFAPLFGAPAVPATPVAPPAISEGLTSLLVLVAVAIGLVIAWMRYATAAAQREAASRLAIETQRMPALLTNLFYFDAAIDLIFVRPAQAARPTLRAACSTRTYSTAQSATSSPVRAGLERSCDRSKPVWSAHTR